VPAQLRDLNEGVLQGRVEIGEIRTDLREHMAEEERLRKEENARQRDRQEDIEIRMEAGEKRFDALDAKIDGVNSAVGTLQVGLSSMSEQLSDTLGSLKAGNPEVRRVQT
jgi:chromosome segregation ATPase